MPLDLAEAIAEAISESEAVPVVAVLLLAFFGEEAMAFEDETVELPEAVVGVEFEVGGAAAAPESISDFLLPRPLFVLVAVVSVLAAVLAESDAAVSEFLLFFLLFFDPVSLGVAEVSDPAAAVSAEAVFLLFFDFLAVVEEVSEEVAV